MKNYQWIWYFPLCVLLIICLVLSFTVSKSKPVPETDTYDFCVSVKDNRLTGRETVTVYNRTNKQQDALFFCLYANAFRDEERVTVTEKRDQAYPNGFSTGKTDVLRVCVNGKEVPFSLEENEEILSVPTEDFLPRKSVTIQIDFTDVLPNSRSRYGKGEDTLQFGNWYAVLCPFQNGEAIKTLYTPFGDPFYSECADYHMELHAPCELRLATSGVIESKQDEAFETVWRVTGKRMRDFAFVLSQNSRLQSRHAGNTLVYAYGFDHGTQEALSYACAALECFSDFFGEYPYETFSVVASDLYVSGMEYPSLVMIDRDLFTPDMLETLEETIVHETAHQWFYGLVGNDQSRHAWLDEGLAQYCTALYYEKTYGEERYRSFIHESEMFVRSVLEVMDRAYGDANCEIERETASFEHYLLYNAMCYEAPCVMLNCLRDLIGKDCLLDGLRSYVDENAFQIADPKKFNDALNKATNKRIDTYLSSWLNGEVYWE